jgi:hypothetical protein
MMDSLVLIVLHIDFEQTNSVPSRCQPTMIQLASILPAQYTAGQAAMPIISATPTPSRVLGSLTNYITAHCDSGFKYTVSPAGTYGSWTSGML